MVVFEFYFVYFFLQTLFFVHDLKCIRSVKIKVDRTDVDEEWRRVVDERCVNKNFFFDSFFSHTSGPVLIATQQGNGSKMKQGAI